MKDKVKVINKHGVEKEYFVLSTFEYKNKKFIIYTDYSKNEENNINVFASIYENEDEIIEFCNINNQEYNVIVKNYIKMIEEKVNKND